MLMDAVHGFGSGVLMLIFSGAILAVGWGAHLLRDRSHDINLTYRYMAAGVVTLGLVAALVAGSGQRVQWFFFMITVVGVPIAVGLAPRGILSGLLRGEDAEKE